MLQIVIVRDAGKRRHSLCLGFAPTFRESVEDAFR